MRGKPLAEALPEYLSRLIPACAGKTQFDRVRADTGKAHPRVCGENDRLEIGFYIDYGSSPRVRGKLPPSQRRADAKRLIPACAGKTDMVEQLGAVIGAHPRVCGENMILVTSSQRFVGSSTRVRGKPAQSQGFLRARGLIPACAGKTRVTAQLAHILRAHPRVCGENFAPAHSISRAAGSSPRVRGKR